MPWASPKSQNRQCIDEFLVPPFAASPKPTRTPKTESSSSLWLFKDSGVFENYHEFRWSPQLQNRAMHQWLSAFPLRRKPQTSPDPQKRNHQVSLGFSRIVVHLKVIMTSGLSPKLQNRAIHPWFSDFPPFPQAPNQPGPRKKRKHQDSFGFVKILMHLKVIRNY